MRHGVHAHGGAALAVLVGVILSAPPARAQLPLDWTNPAAILERWTTSPPQERAALLAGMLDRRDTVMAALRGAVLTAPDPGARAAACALLGQLRDAGALPALLAATRDARADVRARAVTALGRLRDPAAAPRLRALLAAPQTAGAVRKRAMVALGALGDPADQAAVRPFVTDPDPSTQVVAAGALAQLGSPEAEDVLLAALDGDDPRAQKNATYALGFTGTPTARARLEEIVADPAGRWKSYAIIALAESDGRVQTPPVRAAVLEQLAAGRDRIVTQWALDRLVDLGGPEAAAALQRLAARPGVLGRMAGIHWRLATGR